MSQKLNRLDRIRRKLDTTLRSYDIEECADLDLGIKKHRFRLGPPLPESEVAVFEEQYGISLPPDYRAFITSVGISGAGPYYGLLPLAQATDHLDCDDEAMRKQKLAEFQMEKQVDIFNTSLVYYPEVNISRKWLT